ncbi:hypothetical protein D3C85_1302570 [compost metagenome]
MFCGYGMPWEIIVVSRATIGLLFASASFTSSVKVKYELGNMGLISFSHGVYRKLQTILVQFAGRGLIGLECDVRSSKAVFTGF